MRRITRWIAVMAAAGTVLAISPITIQSAVAASATRIMVVGDSISQGSAGDFTWRYRLAKHLTASGALVDFVGPRSDLFDNVSGTQGSTAYADPAFDRDHNAVWGRSLAQAQSTIQADLTASPADVVLLLIGTNDLFFLTGPEDTDTQLRSFIANARAANPDVKLVLGTVIPRAADPSFLDFQSRVDEYNALLRVTASRSNTASAPVVVADSAFGYDPSTDSWDGTHPNALGEQKIAAAFADTLVGSFGIGSSYARPLASLPVGPRTAPVLSGAVGNAQVGLSWSSSPGATGYYVWTRSVTNGESFYRLPYALGGTSWTAGSLVNGAVYEFKMQPTKGDAAGVFSNTITVSPTGPAPAAPSTLTAAAGNGQAVLTWSASANATGYYVWTRNVTSGEAFYRLPYALGGTSWTAGSLVNGATYEFKMQPTNGLIVGAFSPVTSVRPIGPTPTGPTSFTATAGDAQAVLSWTPAANATGVYVWTRNVTAGEAFRQLPYALGGSSWTAGLLTNGATYEFKLQSVNGLIAGGFSTVATVKPSGAVPSAATGLTATAGNRQATLRWTAGANATGYYVLTRNVTAGETAFTKLPIAIGGTSWVAGALANGSTYEFKLQSVNGLVSGGTSNTVSVRPTAAAPAAPTGLTVTGGFGQATLKWTAAATATGYYLLQRNTTAGETTFTKLPIPISGTSFTAGLLKPGSRYEFKLQSVDGTILGGTSATVAVTLSAVPSVGGVSAVPPAGSHNTLKVSWTAIAGADEYWVYQGTRLATGGLICDIASMTLVQFGVTTTSWTQSLLPEGLSCYGVIAIKNGVKGSIAVTSTNFGYPLVESIPYLQAKSLYFDTAQPSTSRRYTTNVGSGPDRGIVVIRAFIMDKAVGIPLSASELAGDNRGSNTSVGRSSRGVVAWNTLTGDVTVTFSESCLYPYGALDPNPPFLCLPSRSIQPSSNAYAQTDFAVGYIPSNFVTVSKQSDGALKFSMAGYNSVSLPALESTNGLTAAAPAINSEVQISPSNRDSSGYVKLRGDRFPSYEFIQYNRWVQVSAAEGISSRGTVMQNQFYDLLDGNAVRLVPGGPYVSLTRHKCSGTGSGVGELTCQDGDIW